MTAWRALIVLPAANVEELPDVGPVLVPDVDMAGIDRMRVEVDAQAPTGYVLIAEALLRRDELGVADFPAEYALVRTYDEPALTAGVS